MEATQRPDVWRTQPDGVRSGHGDTDLVLYSLRKYLKLAVEANPTVLVPQYAPEPLAPSGAFLSRQAVQQRFLGTRTAQHQRTLGGGRRNRMPYRPELIERYGWSLVRRSQRRSPRPRRR